MTSQQGKRNREGGKRKVPPRALNFLLPCALFLCGACGCTWDRWHWFAPPPPPLPADSLVLHGDKLEAEMQPKEGTPAADLVGAEELYAAGEYSQAERVFHRVAENKKAGPQVAEEARFYEAECIRCQGRYPKAADTYNKVLIDFPSGAFREQAVQRMFDIANFWLDDTRKEMEEEQEAKEGKRWVVWPEFVHFANSKPFMDEEGRAMEKLEQVRYNDMTGPLADKALFLAGSVKFFRQDYKDAAHYYKQLVEMHPNSLFATEAVKLAILSMQMSTGGSAYDGRQVAEARKLVDTALRNYPELASKEADFLQRQIASISLQQAEKDYEVAEFYKRTGHPCSAYFCYEVVRRRYPGTKYFDLATERMHQLRDKLEKSETESVPEIPLPSSSASASRTGQLKTGMPLEQMDRLPAAPKPLPEGMFKDR